MENFSVIVLFLSISSLLSGSVCIYAYVRNQHFASYRAKTSNLEAGLRLIILGVVLLLVYLFTT